MLTDSYQNRNHHRRNNIERIMSQRLVREQAQDHHVSQPSSDKLAGQEDTAKNMITDKRPAILPVSEACTLLKQDKYTGHRPFICGTYYQTLHVDDAFPFSRSVASMATEQRQATP